MKDGDNNPSGYVFDISAWNGIDNIEVMSFWPQQGTISHVTILTGPGRNVPDGGATVALLGFSVAALGLSRRFIKR